MEVSNDTDSCEPEFTTPGYRTENLETRDSGMEPGVDGICEGIARRMLKDGQHRKLYSDSRYPLTGRR